MTRIKRKNRKGKRLLSLLSTGITQLQLGQGHHAQQFCQKSLRLQDFNKDPVLTTFVINH